jgi:hypothetical protein
MSQLELERSLIFERLAMSAFSGRTRHKEVRTARSTGSALDVRSHLHPLLSRGLIICPRLAHAAARRFRSLVAQQAPFRPSLSSIACRVFSVLRLQPQKVWLNVYDLNPNNDALIYIGLGAFHSGVEVHGTEYTFGSGACPGDLIKSWQRMLGERSLGELVPTLSAR